MNIVDYNVSVYFTLFCVMYAVWIRQTNTERLLDSKHDPRLKYELNDMITYDKSNYNWKNTSRIDSFVYN